MMQARMWHQPEQAAMSFMSFMPQVGSEPPGPNQIATCNCLKLHQRRLDPRQRSIGSNSQNNKPRQNLQIELSQDNKSASNLADRANICTNKDRRRCHSSKVELYRTQTPPQDTIPGAGFESG